MTGLRRWYERPAATIGLAIANSTFCVLPRALLASQAVLVERALNLGPAAFGASFSLWYVASSLGSLLGGWTADRLGSRTSVMVASGGTCLSLLGIAAAQGPGELFGFLVLGALASSLAQPAGNLVLAYGVASTRHGLAFGIKQAAGPTALLLAGVAVPVIGLQLGWRWAFALAALGLLPVQLLARAAPGPPRVEHAAAGGRRLQLSRALAIFGAAGALAIGATSAMTAFYVLWATSRGQSPAAAGLLLACGSACGISARVICGWWTDRHASAAALMICLLVAGGAGFLLLTIGATWALLVGTGIAFGAGWGWPGLLQLTIVREHPRTPGAASGVLFAATRIGGAIGPVAFGMLVAHVSYAGAWAAGAAALLLSACLVNLGRQRLRVSVRAA